MFDIGIQELIVIFVIILVVFGPEKLPEIARVFGKGIGDLQRTLRSAKDELDTEVTKVKDEVKNELKDPIALKNELFNTNDLFAANTEKASPEQFTETEPDAYHEHAAEEQDAAVHEDQAPPAQQIDRLRVLEQINKSLRGPRNV